MGWKNSGRERICAALSIILGTPCRRLGSRWAPRSCPRAPRHRGMDEHKLGPRMFAIAVAAALAAEAAGTPDLDPVRGAVDGAVEAGWVDERFDEQQRVEACRSLTRRRDSDSTREPRLPGAGIGSCWEKMQPVELDAEAPASTGRARHTSAPAPRTPPAPATGRDDGRARPIPVACIKARNRFSTVDDRATNAAMPPCGVGAGARARGECRPVVISLPGFRPCTQIRRSLACART